jgi:RimJ/RimL family protein N-acetyltransferase
MTVKRGDTAELLGRRAKCHFAPQPANSFRVFRVRITDMNEKVVLRPVREEDMPIILQWWNDPDNFGATGLEQGISLEAALRKFRARPSTEPFEEWFAICSEESDEPLGILIVAPGHPQEDLLSIGSLIVDKRYRRRGIGRQAVEEMETWARERYLELTLSLGVFESFPGARSFWEACGYVYTETVDTDYVYRGRKQRAFRFRKRLGKG